MLSKLIAWKNSPDRKPLLLQGARQVGKTTLLHQFGKEYFRKVHSFNFEENLKLAELFSSNLDPTHLIQLLQFHQDVDIDVDRDLLVFDEIQSCPRAITSLKYFQEKMPRVAICAAGSLLGVYLAPVSFPVGKVDILHLYPMCFEEFLLAQEDHKSLAVLDDFSMHNKEIPRVAHDHLLAQFKQYLIVGGLPEVVGTFIQHRENPFVAFQKVRERQKSLLATYLADIAKHSGPVNAMHIARIFESVPAQLSRSQDGSAPKFVFKGVVPGVDRYSKLVGALDWLEKAGLIIKVLIVNSGRLPFSAYSEENVFKMYLFDVGLLGAMCQLTPKMILDFDWGSYKGFFVENYVAQELLTAGKEKLYSWHEKTAEVEFLHEVDGSPVPVEVKSGWVTQSKSAKMFSDKYTCPYYVVFNADLPALKERVRRYPLYLAGRFLHLR